MLKSPHYFFLVCHLMLKTFDVEKSESGVVDYEVVAVDKLTVSLVNLAAD